MTRHHKTYYCSYKLANETTRLCGLVSLPQCCKSKVTKLYKPSRTYNIQYTNRFMGQQVRHGTAGVGKLVEQRKVWDVVADEVRPPQRALVHQHADKHGRECLCRGPDLEKGLHISATPKQEEREGGRKRQGERCRERDADADVDVDTAANAATKQKTKQWDRVSERVEPVLGTRPVWKERKCHTAATHNAARQPSVLFFLHLLVDGHVVGSVPKAQRAFVHDLSMLGHHGNQRCHIQTWHDALQVVVHLKYKGVGANRGASSSNSSQHASSARHKA